MDGAGCKERREEGRRGGGVERKTNWKKRK